MKNNPEYDPEVEKSLEGSGRISFIEFLESLNLEKHFDSLPDKYKTLLIITGACVNRICFKKERGFASAFIWTEASKITGIDTSEYRAFYEYCMDNYINT